MRILFTNHLLEARTGTELYVREIAPALARRGHEVTCFTRRAGELADELVSEGIAVTTDISTVERPDLVHGHHLVETSLAAVRFPDVPVISFCHGPKAWQETPSPAPNVVCFAAVDHACRNRLIDQHGIAPERIRVLYNYVDTERFAARGDPLPPRPARALLFSNYATAGAAYVEVLAEACRAAGMEFETVGAGAGSATGRPEEVLVGADVVFAKARCALEAMAVGCAVVQCEYFGAGRLVTTQNFDELRRLNFGYASMTFPLNVEHLASQIAGYDPADAAAVSRRVRAEAGIRPYVEQLETLHAECASRKVVVSTAAEHLAAHAAMIGDGAAAHLAGWDAGELVRAKKRAEKLEDEATRYRNQRAKDKERIARLRSELDRAKAPTGSGKRRPGFLARLLGRK